MKKLTSIDKGISRVNEGIDSLNSTIKDGNAIMGELSKNMSKISEATYLQNALLEKISVDSMSLVKDTHYMIDYKTPETIVKFKIPTRAENKESVKESKTVS
jgi:methyl-accepting chemotaxis protein